MVHVPVPVRFAHRGCCTHARRADACPRRYLLVKGILMSVLGLIKLSYCKKSLGIDGTACQTMGVIAQTPWAIKGAIGVLSDAYPFLGYHKASYIIASAVLGTLAFLGLATLPIASAAIAAMLMFAANLEIATADLLCEGKYAELMQTKPKTGSTMVSFVWGSFQVGSLIAACFVGPVADAYDPKVLFLFLTPVAASIIVPTGLGYLADERVPDEQAGFKTDLIRQYPYVSLNTPPPIPPNPLPCCHPTVPPALAPFHPRPSLPPSILPLSRWPDIHSSTAGT